MFREIVKLSIQARERNSGILCNKGQEVVCLKCFVSCITLGNKKVSIKLRRKLGNRECSAVGK